MSHNYCEYINIWNSLIKKIFKLKMFLANLAQSGDRDLGSAYTADQKLVFEHHKMLDIFRLLDEEIGTWTSENGVLNLNPDYFQMFE